MASRYYSSVAALTTLTNGVSAGDAALIVGSTSGFPAQTPFTLLLDEGTASEEIVTVTAVAGTTLTVVRGEDGTVPVEHGPGARVRHAMTARDLRESREHEAAITNVHGIADTSSLAVQQAPATFTSLTASSLTVAGNDPFSPWQSYTPDTLSLNLGGGEITARYKLIGKTCHARVKARLGPSGSVNGPIWFTLPVPLGPLYAIGDALGSGRLLDASIGDSSATGATVVIATILSGSWVTLLTDRVASSADIGADRPWTWASDDEISFSCTYEAN